MHEQDLKCGSGLQMQLLERLIFLGWQNVLALCVPRIGLAQNVGHIDLIVAAVAVRALAVDIGQGPDRLAVLLLGQDIRQVIGTDFTPQGGMQQRQVFGAKVEAAVWRLT